MEHKGKNRSENLERIDRMNSELATYRHKMKEETDALNRIMDDERSKVVHEFYVVSLTGNR